MVAHKSYFEKKYAKCNFNFSQNVIKIIYTNTPNRLKNRNVSHSLQNRYIKHVIRNRHINVKKLSW